MQEPLRVAVVIITSNLQGKTANHLSLLLQGYLKAVRP